MQLKILLRVQWTRLVVRGLRCPGNLYRLSESYFSDKTAFLTMNTCTIQKEIRKECPHGSASGPGFWKLLYISLLNLKHTKNNKVIAYADDLLILVNGKTQVKVEKYANIETQKVAQWARNNKMSFNDQKSKITIITRQKHKNRRDFKIYLNNKKIKQEGTLKYLGITIDRRFIFNQHIDNVTGKFIKIIHALSKSAKINWG
jgi:hypothetical protein